ncbi:MAG: hypothetical protein ACETWK_06825 [Candidatus Aminicenantaceae bacterium]
MCDASIAKDELCYTDSSSLEYIDTYALIDWSGDGIFSYSFPIENWAFEKTYNMLASWRTTFPEAGVVKDFVAYTISQAYSCFVTSTIPTDIGAPLEFAGKKVFNRSLSQGEYINHLEWRPNPKNESINKYNIYLVEGAYKYLLAQVASGSFEYMHRNVDKDAKYLYAIFPVTDEGREGNPVTTTIQ